MKVYGFFQIELLIEFFQLLRHSARLTQRSGVNEVIIAAAYQQMQAETSQMIASSQMTQEEQIRLYRLMEKLNWFFHQEMHYLNRDIAEKTARECYPEIREFTYDILWNDLPKEVQDQLTNER